MTASTDFDRLVASWLETAGPADVVDDVVTAAFVETRTLPQRRGLRGRLAGSDPWPQANEPGQLLRGLPAVVAAALLLLALVGLAAVGARLVDQVVDPVMPSTFSGPYPMPVPATLGIQASDGSVIVFGGEEAGRGGPGSASNDPEQILRLIRGRNELVSIGTTPGTVTAAIGLRDGTILVVLPGVPARDAQSVVGILSPATGEVVVAGQTPASHLNGAAVQVGPDDPRVLFVGDAAGSREAALFDPRTNQFAPAAPTRGLMRQPRAVRLGDGSILVVGEWNRIPERFDPVTETWSQVAPMAASREGFSVVALKDGRVLVAGGLIVQGEIGEDALLRPAGPSTVAATAEVYDPATDTWTTVGPLVHPRWMHAAHALPDGSVLLAGGTGSALASASDGGLVDPVILEAERFDPVTGTFLPAGSLALPRLNPGIVGLASGEALVLGSVRPTMGRLGPDGAGSSFERYGEVTAPPDPMETSVALNPVPASLVGRWVADVTDGRSFGPSGPKRLTLSIGPERAIVTVSGQPDVLVPSIAGMDPVTGELVLVSDSTGERSPLALNGTPLAPCAKGEASAYRVEHGASEAILRLRAIRETCRARSALVSGLWTWSLAGDSAGGSGVIETVRPPLHLELPTAAYRTEESNGGIVISGDNGVRVSAWEDPFVFEDGCSVDSLPVDPGRSATAFVEALRRTRGLEVVSAEPVTLYGISGDPAAGVTRVRVRTLPGACGDGREAASVAAWLPRVGSGTPDAPALVAPGEERVVHVFDYDPSDPSEPSRTMVVEVVAADPAVAAAVLESVSPIAGVSPYDDSHDGPQ